MKSEIILSICIPSVNCDELLAQAKKLQLIAKGIKHQKGTRAFLKRNFPHIWRGLIIDWVRIEMPRPTASLWALKRSSINLEYWQALLLSLFTKNVIRLMPAVYKFFFKKHF